MGIEWWMGAISTRLLPEGFFPFEIVAERAVGWSVFRTDGELLVIAKPLEMANRRTGSVHIHRYSLTTSARAATKMLISAGIILNEAEDGDNPT